MRQAALLRVAAFISDALEEELELDKKGFGAECLQSTVQAQLRSVSRKNNLRYNLKAVSQLRITNYVTTNKCNHGGCLGAGPVYAGVHGAAVSLPIPVGEVLQGAGGEGGEEEHWDRYSGKKRNESGISGIARGRAGIECNIMYFFALILKR